VIGSQYVLLIHPPNSSSELCKQCNIPLQLFFSTCHFQPYPQLGKSFPSAYSSWDDDLPCFESMVDWSVVIVTFAEN